MSITDTDAYWVESPFEGKVCIVGLPRGNDALEDEIVRFKTLGLSVLVSLLEAQEADELGLAEEESLSANVGIEFRSFPIPDRGVPHLAEFRQFTENICSILKQGKWVGVHCRAGIGRSSLLVAAVLVSSGRPPEQAWLKVENARGRPVPDTQEQRLWLYTFARRA